MATARMILIVRNQQVLVPILGFFEVLIWVLAVGVVVQHLTSPLHLLGYAGGFATGNLVGLVIEERLALGVATVQTVVQHGGRTLATLRCGGRGWGQAPPNVGRSWVTVSPCRNRSTPESKIRSTSHGARSCNPKCT
jgi:hypothetical protein